MLKKSARRLVDRRLIAGVWFFVFSFLFFVNTSCVLAQTVTPTAASPAATSTPVITPTPSGTSIQLQSSPGEPNWRVDAEVTQVGKNAERSRQLIYWVVKHPVLVNVPVIARVWATVRNVAYAMSLLVIIGLALHLIISRRGIGPTFTGISLGLEKLTLLNIVVRIIAILLFITLSYSIMRITIEGVEVTSRFFIETLGGEDLFNVVFSGGNVEDNYTTFVGYRNADPLEQEMANTSLFVVRLTSFTYNFMSVILILRQVILLFLLIISPILAILMPFIFIRNTGFIWIGEFLRWLFYGPLFAIFISALAQIWKSGLPYAFDFNRARAGEMIYPTAINILYGGPAQVLSPTNTSNYIDTYAEYVIALIMLWAAIILPWILLRIFRDYCCDILRENQNALLQILDKMRNFGKPPSPPPARPGPTTAAGRAFELPFRQNVFEQKTVEKQRVIEKIRERNIENVSTQDLVRAVNLEVKSLRDIAKSETNKQFSSNIQSTLKNIQNPASASNLEERRDYSTLREALMTRAAQGDKEAKKVMQALTPKVVKTPNIISQGESQALKEAVEKPGMPVVIPQIARIPTARTTPVVSTQVLSNVSQKAQVSQEKVEEVLKHLPTITGTEDEKNKKLAQKTNLSEEKVKEVLKNIPQEVIREQEAAAPPPTVSVEDYEEVKSMWLNHYRKSEVPKSEKIKDRNQWLEKDVKDLTNTINLLTSASVKDRQKGMEEVANLLPFLLLGGFGDLETLTYIKAKLEAAKQVQTELEKIYEAKEEAKKEDEKEKVKVPLGEEEEEKKTMEAQAQREMPLPEEDNQPEKPKSLFEKVNNEPENKQS